MTHLVEQATGSDHFFGSLSAPTILVVYGDYQCVACKMTSPILKMLRKEFGDKLLIVFRHFPLKSSHPFSFDAAKAAEAAALQGKFWEMHEELYAHQGVFSPECWLKLAEELHLDLDRFNRDFQSDKLKEKLEKEFMAGVRSGVNRIPCFFINGERFDGDASYENLLQALRAAQR